MANALALLPVPVLVGQSGRLLDMISYLPFGVGTIAGFVGVKIVLQALHNNAVPFLNGGEPAAWAPDISPFASLSITVGTVGIAVAASLLRYRQARRRNDPAIPEAEQRADRAEAAATAAATERAALQAELDDLRGTLAAERAAVAQLREAIVAAQTCLDAAGRHVALATEAACVLSPGGGARADLSG
jgi:hypothetical protein